MKRILSVLWLLACTCLVQAQTNEVLTNETVVLLVQKGLSSGVVVNKIKASKTNFDVSTDALIALKEKNVPDEVVSAMVEYGAAGGHAVSDATNPLAAHPSGIYYYHPGDTDKKLLRLDPTVVSSSKSGGVGTALAQSYSYGLASNKQVSIISGNEARKQFDDSLPVFYFYFEHNQNGLGSNHVNWWFATASSPNEFALVRLRNKNGSRELEIGSSNAYGSSVGISEKQKIDFTYEEVGEHIFRVVVKKLLPPGEYCFVYTGATPSVYTNNKVFDFGTY